MRLYLAGPMTGLPAFNFPAFDKAAAKLRGLGHEVCNPAEHDREMHGDKIEASATGDPADASAVGFSLRDALAFDLDWIARNAEGVAVLDGWEASKGARAEVALAHALGLPVVPVYAWLHVTWHVTPYVTGHVIEPAATAQADTAPSVTVGEVRTTSSSGGEKGVKPARFDLIPAGPLWQVAEHYGRGAAKYADRNWERGYEWSKSFGALMRHASLFWQGEDYDAETTSHHMAAVAFHALALIEFADTHPEFDDRPATAAAREAARERETREAFLEACENYTPHIILGTQ